MAPKGWMLLYHASPGRELTGDEPSSADAKTAQQNWGYYDGCQGGADSGASDGTSSAPKNDTSDSTGLACDESIEHYWWMAANVSPLLTVN
jgi:hypothetical protein